MALSSRRPARRSITAAAVGLVTAGFVASFAVTTSASAAPPSGSGEIRPGCGSFCQSAGQYGAAGSAAPSPVTILSSGTVTVEPDGYVPVTLKCNLQVQCTGALLLELSGWSNPQDSMSWITARSDLVVNAGATQTIGVPLPSPAITYLRSNGPTQLSVTGDTNDMGAYQLASAKLTLAAPS
jgi:hypothetical protein